MSDALLGTIIGGAISLAATALTAYVQHRRWIKEIRINRLQVRRVELESAIQKTLKELAEGARRGDFPLTILSELDYHFPEYVIEAVHTFWGSLGDESGDAQKLHIDVTFAMRRALAEVDKELDELIKE